VIFLCTLKPDSPEPQLDPTDHSEYKWVNAEEATQYFEAEDEELKGIAEGFDLLQEYGPAVQMPYVRRISPQLSELRVRGREEVRLFFTIRKLTIYILHGFTKKTQKIPTKELKMAINRLEEI
jgi:phage-related protein